MHRMIYCSRATTDLSGDDLVALLDVARTRNQAAGLTVALRLGVEPSLRHLLLRGKTVERDRRGRPIRSVGVLIDVTTERAMEEHLMRLVMSDPLTGLANRRSFDQALRTELRRATRSGLPLSLLMVDIDHFKRFNDTHGHLVGDDVLCLVARALTGAVVRPGDLVRPVRGRGVRRRPARDRRRGRQPGRVTCAGSGAGGAPATGTDGLDHRQHRRSDHDRRGAHLGGRAADPCGRRPLPGQGAGPGPLRERWRQRASRSPHLTGARGAAPAARPTRRPRGRGRAAGPRGGPPPPRPAGARPPTR